METLHVGIAAALEICGLVCLVCHKTILRNHWSVKVTHQEDSGLGYSVGYHCECVPQSLREKWVTGDFDNSQ